MLVLYVIVKNLNIINYLNNKKVPEKNKTKVLGPSRGKEACSRDSRDISLLVEVRASPDKLSWSTTH